jgi:hypothetical protein
VASTASNKNYDLGTLAGDSSYQVPAFTLSPAGSPGTIIYSDAAPIPEVTFDTSNRIFSWPSLGTGTYTLTMEGSLAGSTSVTTSFSLTITETTLSVTNDPVDQSYDLGTAVGANSYTVPAFTSNPPGASITYSDVSVSIASDIKFTGTSTYDWSLLKIPGIYTLEIQGSLLSPKSSVKTSFTLTITETTISVGTIPADQTYDIGTCAGSISLTVPSFTSNPLGAKIKYFDVSNPKITDVTFKATTYDWSLLKTVGIYTLTMKGSLGGPASTTTSFKLEIK